MKTLTHFNKARLELLLNTFGKQMVPWEKAEVFYSHGARKIRNSFKNTYSTSCSTSHELQSYFLLGFFQKGGKIYSHANFYCFANLCNVLVLNFKGRKSLPGEA